MKKITDFILHEVVNLAIGYLAGLGATRLVERYFVKKGWSNLWGLAAKREAVSGDTYEWLLFGVSYGIGLAVLLLINQLMKKINPKKAKTEG